MDYRELRLIRGLNFLRLDDLGDHVVLDVF